MGAGRVRGQSSARCRGSAAVRRTRQGEAVGDGDLTWTPPACEHGVRNGVSEAEHAYCDDCAFYESGKNPGWDSVLLSQTWLVAKDDGGEKVTRRAESLPLRRERRVLVVALQWLVTVERASSAASSAATSSGVAAPRSRMSCIYA